MSCPIRYPPREAVRAWATQASRADPRVIALVLAGCFGGIRIFHSARDAMARHDLAAARRSMARLTVPSNYHRLADGCRWYRCYIVDSPTPAVAPSTFSVFASTGATSAKSSGPLKNSPLTFFGCDTMAFRHRQITNCTLTGYLHHQLVILFLRPYYAGPAHRNWYWTKIQIDISFDPNHPAGSTL